MDNVINSFDIKNTLCDKIWDNTNSNLTSEMKLKSDVRLHILKIAELFIESANIDSINVHDVLLVGSIVNYNWSKYSDIDIHVVLDKSKLGDNEKLVDEFLKTKKENFNNLHDIKIKEFDTELYFQDINEVVDSSGIYSALFNKWISEPDKDSKSFNKRDILKKVKIFYSIFNDIKSITEPSDKIKKIDLLKDKIKKFRKSGLEEHGELGVENMVFKYLRRVGFIEELNDLKYNTIDKNLSLENKIKQ